VKRFAGPLLALGAFAALVRPAHVINPVPSFTSLVTGNGYGFEVYDTTANTIDQYLERPYRYTTPSSSNVDAEGVVRRNLAGANHFGLQVGSTATWLNTISPSLIEYVSQSTMVHTTVSVAGVQADSYFVAPFGYPGNGLVMLVKVTNTTGSAQTVTAFSMQNFMMGTATNPDMPGGDGEAITYTSGAPSYVTETGNGGGTMIYVPIGGLDVSSCASNNASSVSSGAGLTQTGSCHGTNLTNAFQKGLGSLAPGATAWWGVGVLFQDDNNVQGALSAWSKFAGTQTPDALYAAILAEHEMWRTPPVPGLSATETAIWRQQESVLRMAQIQEPWSDTPQRHNTGMILASLPPGQWQIGWVRDGTYAINALARTGHGANAKAALEFMLDADAGYYSSYVGNVPYTISVVRYFGTGREESDFSGQPTRNIEIDGWGLYLWAARTYVDASGDTAWLSGTTHDGTVVYDKIKNGIASALETNLEADGLPIADTSIWEVHWANRQHFFYTAAAAARGFCDMATLARRAGRTADIAHYQQLAQKAQSAITTNFIDHMNVLGGSLEKLASGGNYHDGSTIESVTWSLVKPTDPIANATLAGLSYLVTPAGGYKRLEGSTDEYDIDEWILIDLRASDAFRRAGMTGQADQLLDWVTSQASVNYNLMPELYNTVASSGTIGSYTGSIPMVGYGAGAWLMTQLDKVQLYEHTDCGQDDLNQYPDGGPVLAGDGGSGAGSNGLTGRTGVACACNGGAGSPATGAVMVLAGALALRRRRVRLR
jgi:hypothetical protein